MSKQDSGSLATTYRLFGYPLDANVGTLFAWYSGCGEEMRRDWPNYHISYNDCRSIDPNGVETPYIGQWQTHRPCTGSRGPLRCFCGPPCGTAFDHVAGCHLFELRSLRSSVSNGAPLLCARRHSENGGSS